MADSRTKGWKGWAAIEVARIRGTNRAGVWAHLPDDALAMTLLLLREFADLSADRLDPIENYAATLALYEMGFLQTYRKGDQFALRHSIPTTIAKQRPVWDGEKVLTPPGYPDEHA